MAKSFNRLRKSIEGRASSRDRVIPWSARLSALEVAVLELMAYLSLEVANDPESPSDANLTEAYTEFKKQLEQVVKSNG